MIRIVTIFSLVSLLMLVLYLPAAKPAGAFISHVRIEHASLAEFWGQDHAIAMLAKMLDLQPDSTPNPPLISIAQGPAGRGGKVPPEVAAVGSRLLNNEYFRSLNALLVLATYRAAVVLYLFPGLVPFFVAALVDGVVRRSVKGKDFSGHNPEVFAVCMSGAIVACCCLVITCVLPIQLPVALMPVLMFCCGALANIGLANYHKRL
jgi:hypothetical protein